MAPIAMTAFSRSSLEIHAGRGGVVGLSSVSTTGLMRRWRGGGRGESDGAAARVRMAETLPRPPGPMRICSCDWKPCRGS